MKSFLHSRAARYMSVVTLMGGGAAGVLTAAPSGATFTADQQGTATMNTATLGLNLSDTHGNTGTFKLAFDNVAPGDTKSDVFYVKNTGSIAAEITADATIGAFTGGTPANPGLLKVGVDPGLALTSFVSLAGKTQDLGSIDPGQTRGFKANVALDTSAGNDWQGISGSANIKITLTQK